MKYALLITVACVACFVTFVRAIPTVMDFEGDEHAHKQEGEAGDKVEGYYSWTSPEGEEFYVKYVADEDGYRVVDSNAVPVSHAGVKANGNQGSFGGEEETA
ncbi:larval cuticle protein 2-like [Macrobrachium nipponense]|uniref:larval cuticle protein 2-like n=1 Tax=Macrobrachium nipponense TaxID=159736 RepID=UPI0030C855EF